MVTDRMRTVTLGEAAVQLPELVRLATQGAEVIITDGDAPIARLVPATPLDQPRTPGLSQGAAWMSDDFNSELPDEFWYGKE